MSEVLFCWLISSATSKNRNCIKICRMYFHWEIVFDTSLTETEDKVWLFTAKITCPVLRQMCQFSGNWMDWDEEWCECFGSVSWCPRSIGKICRGLKKLFNIICSFFSHESDSTIANVCLSVRLSVHLQNPSTAWNHHPSSFILHPSSFFIILHSSFLHFATFKLFSLFQNI